MDTKNVFHFPILKILRVRPLLQKANIVFAYEIEAETRGGFIISFYENKGLDVSSFIGKELQCLLEITRGSIKYENKGNASEFLELEYGWHRRMFEFFPDLMDIREKLSDASRNEEIALTDQFENLVTETYQKWGLNGLDIAIYQTKPVFSSNEGNFLLNEYEFEEDLDELELNDIVYIDIQEMFLRGIGPVLSKKEIETKQQRNVYQIFEGKEYTKEEWRSFMIGLSEKQDTI